MENIVNIIVALMGAGGFLSVYLSFKQSKTEDSHEELMELTKQTKEDNKALREENKKLEGTVTNLNKRVDELETNQRIVLEEVQMWKSRTTKALAKLGMSVTELDNS